MPDQPDLPPELDRTEAVRLAADVLDGTPVDWDEASSAVGNDYAAEFRIVAALAAVHRDLCSPGTDDPSPRSSTGNGDRSLGTWGTLTLLERIGQGAFGEVYRARDEALHREVALKLLRPTRSVAEGTATVEEGRLLARIQHDNVVRVFGAQRIGSEVGLWTEFIHGRTLADIVREQGPFSADEAATTGIAICRALSAAHRVGVLHRDVKPQNVMREDGGRIVLLDFGAGRDWRPAVDTGSDLAGTPWYLAPEVIAGQAPTPQADLYSLGVLLFFLVTGEVPVKGTSVDALRIIHGQGAGFKLRDARSDLPAAFVTVVERALRPNPADRFESAGAFESALVDATGTELRDRRGLLVWGRQHVRLVAASILALAAGIGFTTLFWRRSSPAPPPLESTELTGESVEVPAIRAAAISPDGKFLAYLVSGELRLQSPPNGEARHLLDLSMVINNIAWLPDSTGILLSGPAGVWRTSVFGDPLQMVSQLGGFIAVSRDGLVALTTTTRDSIHVLGRDFLDHGEVAHVEGRRTYSRPTWSPDGSRFAYGVNDPLPGLTNAPSFRTIETRRVDGSERAEVFRGLSLLSYVWASDDRILFSQPSVPPAGPFTALWQVRVNARTGQPAAQPELLWHPPRVAFNTPSVTADGRQLVYVVTHGESQNELLEFDPARMSLGTVRLISTRDSYTGPIGWTPAGDALLLHDGTPGNPSGEFKRQPIQGGEPRVLLNTHRDVSNVTLTADGRWMLYADFGAMPGSSRSKPDFRGYIMRVPVGGGSATPLFEAPLFSLVNCAYQAPQVCVAALPARQAQLSVFDPLGGHPRPLAPVSLDPSAQGTVAFDITGDGKRLVVVSGLGEATRSLLVVDVSTGQARRVSCLPCARAMTVAWAPGDNGWIVATLGDPEWSFGAEMWYVDSQGTAKQLWASPFERVTSLAVSPDGRHIARTVGVSRSSVWKLEGF